MEQKTPFIIKVLLARDWSFIKAILVGNPAQIGVTGGAKVSGCRYSEFKSRPQWTPEPATGTRFWQVQNTSDEAMDRSRNLLVSGVARNL